MSVDFLGVKGGGPKYRDNIHDFKAAVFGYSLAGVIAMCVIHAAVLGSPAGHQKWVDVVSAGTTMNAAK
jgi:repressor of nif and glnA expression